MDDVLEDIIVRGQAGEVTAGEVLAAILDGRVIVPLGASSTGGETAFQPVLFDRGGVSYVAVYTSSEKAKHVMPLADHAASMPGREMFRLVGDGVGVVINAGFSAGMEIDPASVADLAQR